MIEPIQPFPAANDADGFAAAHDTLVRLRANVARAVIGQRTVVDELLVCLAVGGHALIEGVPGLGKTLLARSIARSARADDVRIQFTPDLMPSDIVGHAMPDAEGRGFTLHEGPVFANVVVADEINRAPAKAQAALLEAMQERQVSIEGETRALPELFLVVATQNPIEQEGTYPMPQAQLDRFLCKILIDYPSAEEELAMLGHVTHERVARDLDLDALEPVCDTDDLLAVQNAASRVTVDDAVARYVVDVVRATRRHSGIDIGAGPRGTIALLRAARGHALLAGTDFVAPDDVKAVAPSVLRHRLQLTPDLDIEGVRADDIVADLLANTDVPRR